MVGKTQAVLLWGRYFRASNSIDLTGLEKGKKLLPNDARSENH
jgi:hypothetical protein